MPQGELPQGIVCFWCKGVYTCRPSEHVCPDGTTFRERAEKAGQVGGNRYHYGDDEGAKKFDRMLTDLDIKLLKGMKIRPF
jgi:hypothetical protein